MQIGKISDKILNRDTFSLLLSFLEARDHKEVNYMTSKYELALVLNGKLEDEAKSSALEKVQAYIARFGGTVTNVDDWGKKRFAYDIQKMKEGFYYFIQFESENPSCPNELEAHIRIMETVMRYLVVKQEA